MGVNYERYSGQSTATKRARRVTASREFEKKIYEWKQILNKKKETLELKF